MMDKGYDETGVLAFPSKGVRKRRRPLPPPPVSEDEENDFLATLPAVGSGIIHIRAYDRPSRRPEAQLVFSVEIAKDRMSDDLLTLLRMALNTCGIRTRAPQLKALK